MKQNEQAIPMAHSEQVEQARYRMENTLHELSLSMSGDGASEQIQSVTISRGARGSFRVTARVTRRLYIKPAF